MKKIFKTFEAEMRQIAAPEKDCVSATLAKMARASRSGSFDMISETVCFRRFYF